MINGLVICPECDTLQPNDWSDIRAGKVYPSVCPKCSVNYYVVLLDCENCGWSDVLVSRGKPPASVEKSCPACDSAVKVNFEIRDNTIQ